MLQRVRSYVGPKTDLSNLATSIERVGAPRGVLRDLYARLLRARWRLVLVLFASLYIATAAVFGVWFWLSPGSIAGADGSYLDALAFSIQTLSTIGYGALSPATDIAHFLVVVESFVGLIAVAGATGMVFAKFARPSAGVLFSHRAVIARRNGVPALMFRVANERGSDLVGASIRVTALVDDVTEEGHAMRRLHDLPLQRSDSPLLLMSWLVIHLIDEKSPLYGLGADELERGDVRILCNLIGHDGTFNDTIYANHAYFPDDIYCDSYFVDVVERLPESRGFRLDLNRFHDVTPPLAARGDGAM